MTRFTSTCSRISYKLGIDYTELCNAEQSFIDTMNDTDLRDKVINKIIKNGKSNIKYIGSYYICQDETVSDNMITIQPSIITVNDMTNLLVKKRSSNKSLMYFTCGGCVFRLGDNYSHHLAFLWKPGKYLIGFTPGNSYWNAEMTNMVTTSVLKGTGMNIEWDHINGKYGPQEYTSSMLPCIDSLIPPFIYRADSLCQTWVIYWLYNYINNNPASKWTTKSKELTQNIREFIIWILNTFPNIHDYSNDMFQESYPSSQILDEMHFGYNIV